MIGLTSSKTIFCTSTIQPYLNGIGWKCTMAAEKFWSCAAPFQNSQESTRNNAAKIGRKTKVDWEQVLERRGPQLRRRHLRTCHLGLDCISLLQDKCIIARAHRNPSEPEQDISSPVVTMWPAICPFELVTLSNLWPSRWPQSPARRRSLSTRSLSNGSSE